MIITILLLLLLCVELIIVDTWKNDMQGLPASVMKGLGRPK